MDAKQVFVPLTLAGLLSATASAVAQAQQSIDELPSGLCKAVVEATYGVVQDGQACSAPNPAQGMRSAFTAQGIQVSGEGETGGSWTLSLSLEAWGRTGSMEVPSPAEPTVHGRRVEYRRGALTEWYVNDARGLEQGFTIDEQPVGEGPLWLLLSIGGGLSAEVLPTGRDALFTDAEGSELHYTGLRAWDATGRELEALLVVADDELSIQVEDGGTVYPVHVDPWIATEEAKLVASDAAAFHHFGQSVSISGDTAVVGAEWDDHGAVGTGSAYVFVRSGTSWTQQAKLIASDSAANDAFGTSVSIAGETAVIGADSDDHAGGTNAGSAYVFVRSGTSWTEQAKLIASDPAANDSFGNSVSSWGETAVVGAYTDDHPGATNAGSAYVFVRSGTSWTEQAKLTAGHAVAGDGFGISVSIWSDTALVGAHRGDSGAVLGAGSAFVFVRSGTIWTEQAKLTASDKEFGAFFGFAVAISGDMAVVGAAEDDHPGAIDAGSAYVFLRSGTGWTEQAKVTASDPDASALFGKSASISVDTGLFGALWDDPAGIDDAGSAYVFRLSPGPRVIYCTAGTSASGCHALLSATGTASASAASGFLLQAPGVEGSKDGAFFWGKNGKQANPWGNGTSFQCVVPPVTRGGPLTGTGTNGACDGSFAQDLNATWCSTCPYPQKNPGSGAVVQAQLWYRDPLSTSNQTTSLSDAIEFVVAP